MARVKRGTMHTKRRKNILKQAKGFMWGRKNRIKLAKTAVIKAGVKRKGDQIMPAWMIGYCIPNRSVIRLNIETGIQN